MAVMKKACRVSDAWREKMDTSKKIADWLLRGFIQCAYLQVVMT